MGIVLSYCTNSEIERNEVNLGGLSQLSGESLENMVVESNIDEAQRVLSFKDFKGFHEIENIKDRYKIGKTIGEGSFGQVRLALHKQAKVKCVIKIIQKKKVQEHQIFQNLMDNELEVLESLVHPNIVSTYELLEDKHNYFVVSEFVKHGELYNFIV